MRRKLSSPPQCASPCLRTAPVRRGESSNTARVRPPARAAGVQNSGCGSIPSSVSNCRFVSSPPPNPPSPPPLSTTRWHGTTTGRGLEPMAAPTAWAAPGWPTRAARSPYPTTVPYGTPDASSRSTSRWKPELSDQSRPSENSRSSPAKYAASCRTGSASSTESGASTGSAPSRVPSRPSVASRTAGRAWKPTVTRPRRVAASSSGPMPLGTTDHSTTCSLLSTTPTVRPGTDNAGPPVRSAGGVPHDVGVVGDDAVHTEAGHLRRLRRVVHRPGVHPQRLAVGALQLLDRRDVVGADRRVRRIDLVGERRVRRQLGHGGGAEEARNDVRTQGVDFLHTLCTEALDDQLVLDVGAVEPAFLTQDAQGLLLDARVDLRALDLQEQLLVIALEPVQVLRQRGHPGPRESGAEPAARVQLRDLRGGEVLDRPGGTAGEDLLGVGGPAEGGVVHDDQHAVLGELHVVLHPRDTQVVRRVHGGQGVLRGVGGRAPVGVDDRAVLGSRRLRLGGGQQEAGAEQGRCCTGGGCCAYGHVYSSRRDADRSRLAPDPQRRGG